MLLPAGADDGDPGRQPLDEILGGDHDPAPRVGQDLGDPGRRQRRIQRQEGGAAEHGGERADHRGGGARLQHRHDRLRIRVPGGRRPAGAAGPERDRRTYATPGGRAGWPVVPAG
ncbi:hypothetical protein KBX63_09380 [Micromonospora sp. U21]|nr:hypothetical protein [Micromonospora sp. U21]MBQ0902218.1 hypothetical protein [Micromonospora sp. U21]